jgi:hypothetical protein
MRFCRVLNLRVAERPCGSFSCDIQRFLFVLICLQAGEWINHDLRYQTIGSNNVRYGSTTEVEYLNSLAAAFEWESDVRLL